MRKNVLHTKMCDMLGIEFPIMCPGMGGVSGPELVAAVSNAGGIGSLGTGREDPDEMSKEIRKVKALTSKPFAVHLPVRAPSLQPGAETRCQVELPAEHVAFVNKLKEEFGIPDPKNMPEQDVATMQMAMNRKVFEVILEEGVPILATWYGNPAPVIPEAHAHGVKVLALVGSTKHARRCVQAEADILIATGYDAGGHESAIGTMALVPQVVDAAYPTPVIAAGGIMDGRGLAAALALGAIGVVCGTAFLLCHEAGFYPAPIPLAPGESLEDWRYNDIRKQLIEANEEDTEQSRSYTGGPARVLKNAWTDAWKRPGAPQPLPISLQFLLIAELMRGAYEAHRSDLLANPAGQGVGMLKEVKTAREVVFEIVEGARQVLSEILPREVDLSR